MARKDRKRVTVAPGSIVEGRHAAGSGADGDPSASDGSETAGARALDRLLRLSTQPQAAGDFEERVNEVLAAIIELQGADFGIVQLYDPADRSLWIAAQRGFGHDFLEYFRRVDAGDCSACGRALRLRQRVVVADVETDPEFAPVRGIAAAAGYRAVQSTPLIGRDGEALGMLSTHFRKPHQPSERDLRLTDLYVRLAADLIERRRDHDLLERRLAALTSVAAALTLDGTLEAALDAMAATVVGASEAVACAIRLLDEETEEDRYAGSSGMPAGYLAAALSARRAGSPSFAVQALRERRSLFVRDMRRQVLADPLRAAAHPLVPALPWDAVLCLPVLFRGRGLGAMSVYYTPGVEPGTDEVAFLRAVADQAAVAIETARLFAEAQEKAALVERQRLARELHDSVSQVLYSIGLSATAARDSLVSDPEHAAAAVAHVLELAGAGIAELRALIYELSPEALTEEGLVAALGKLVAALRSRHGLAVEATLDQEPDAAPAAKEALYRVGQEATNALRHARAAGLVLRLAATPSSLVLEVEDDGVGFDTAVPFPGHLGLRSMRERVERLGGTLAVESAPGRGTLIRAEVPRSTGG